MPEVRKYAEGTDVPVDKSRAELERIVMTHGATEFAFHSNDKGHTLIYRLNGRMVRQVVEYPDAAPYKKDPRYTWRDRPASQVKNAQEAEWRRRWRAQVLITKAKLELIAGGGSTFEREFLADTLLPNGETVAEAMLPRIAESYATGKMPPLLLGSGG